MSDAQLQVAQAEAQLKAARAAELAEQRGRDRKQLAEVRAQIRTAHTDYERLRRTIRSGEAAVAVQQSHVDGLTNLISEHMPLRPACAEFLPDDPEVVVWQARYDDLQRRRELAIARREEIQAEIPPLAEAAKYEGNLGVIANLERSETNLIRRLKAEPIGATWQGGVSRVL